MMRYLVQFRDKRIIFVTSCGVLSLAKDMGRNIGENVRKNISGKYSKKLLDHANQSTTDILKTTSKKAIQKAEEATGDLIGNKIANRITKVSKRSQQNNSGLVTNEHNKEIPKKRYIHPKERQKITDDLTRV